MKWFLPKRNVWLLFDTANGDEKTRRYLWWFDSRQKAREFKKEHEKYANHYKLHGPVKYYKHGFD